MHTSSTLNVPETRYVPRHVAIIMDGNGRWAKQKFLPRVGGHRRGVESVRETVKACAEWGVEYLSPFDPRIRELIARGEELTAGNSRLTLTVAANYGGRWDILQAADRCRVE